MTAAKAAFPIPCLAAMAAAPMLLVATHGMAAPAATTFKIRQIVIQGNDNFQATSVNASGMIVGTLYAGITDAPTGYAIAGKTATPLPSPGSDFNGFNPRVVTDNGAVLGWSQHSGALNSSIMFLLQNGTFNQAYDQLLIAPGSNVSSDTPLPIDLTNNLKVSFNILYGLSTPIATEYGKPPHYRSVPPMNRFTHVNSINRGGIVAGITYSFSGITAVYTGAGKTFITLAPPNSVETAGGWINDDGAVAGSYRDTSGAWHGFVYSAGAYTSFDMPVPATSVAADAINSKGRVVGTYADAKGLQHGFFFDGQTVSSFGSYPGTDLITAAIGNGGAVVINEQIPAQGPKYLSWSVACSGPGC